MACLVTASVKRGSESHVDEEVGEWLARTRRRRAGAGPEGWEVNHGRTSSLERSVEVGGSFWPSVQFMSSPRT